MPGKALDELLCSGVAVKLGSSKIDFMRLSLTNAAEVCYYLIIASSSLHALPSPIFQIDDGQ
jgi:hypothetical protein